MATAATEFPLHESVFNGDLKRVSKLLTQGYNGGEKDLHGNTPLHLAVMLGHKDCVYLLLAHNAPVNVKNSLGWSPLAEAISYGNRQIIVLLLRKLKKQSRESLEDRRPLLVQALKDMSDFDLELKWDFQSWLPLVSRFLPSDVCRIRKKGCRIRLDTTLVDFSEMRWVRGDITFIFNGEVKRSQKLTVLDNKIEVYQRIRSEDTDQEMEEEVDILMGSDIVAAQMSTKHITFSRAQSGWLFREDKSEMVGNFQSDFYTINNLVLESKKRREHLSPEDVQKNKALMENITKGAWDSSDPNNGYERRHSLKQPQKPPVTWQDYIASDTGKPPSLSRPIVCKESRKGFKATIAMSHDFPMTVDILLDVLEVFAPFKHFQKLRDFMTSKLPPGFPVRIEIPMLPSVTAKVTFTKFEWKEDLDSELFEIPKHYREDPGRFPDL